MAIVVFDVEIYSNYFLLMLQNVDTGNVVYHELYDDHPLDIPLIKKTLRRHTLLSFNGIKFDLPIIYYALVGATTAKLKECCDFIIGENKQPWDCERKFGFTIPKINHIDLIEVAPGHVSLKAYGGRLHSKVIKDLPYEPSASITREMRTELIKYCRNDLQTTIDLYNALKPQIELRKEMGKIYGMDLRSKSDAQIAEAVIKKEVELKSGKAVPKPNINILPFRYQKPEYISFTMPMLQNILNVISEAQFRISPKGKVELPREISELKIKIGSSCYRMGIGGLHSTESLIGKILRPDGRLLDIDVVSYYPTILINNNLYPPAMGEWFLKVYKEIVEKRITAKRAGDKITSDSLKICINGGWGKHGSKYSSFYAPNIIIQTTITGQLSLLMLIERLELSGIAVRSANTDGILISIQRKLFDKATSIIKQWEQDSKFETESVEYRSIYAKDVNNYIAIKKEGGVKLKGSALTLSGLQKNPANEICIEAIVSYLDKGIPIEETIKACTDIRKFISVRKVEGGAVKEGEYLGKVVRWYYSHLAFGDIQYKTNGNRVPRSEDAMPCMTIPDTFPEDVDHDWYVNETKNILREIGA